MKPDLSVRRFVENWRRVEELDWKELSEKTVVPAASVARAEELLAFARKLPGWPIPEDPVSREENRRGAEAWVRLRARTRNM